MNNIYDKYIDAKDLKRKIEDGDYAFQEFLPSENTLVQEYDCSRNTIRRAIAALVNDGYVQTMQGKGVRNIFQPTTKTSFTLTYGDKEIANGDVIDVVGHGAVDGTVGLPQNIVDGLIRYFTNSFKRNYDEINGYPNEN